MLRYSFEPRLKRRALGTAGSVMTSGLSVNGCSDSKNQFDERKQDWLVQKCGLRRLQRLDIIQTERQKKKTKEALLAGCYHYYKVMLHETIRNDDFLRNTALQHCYDIISNSYNIVPTLQRCVALQIIVANRPVWRHLYRLYIWTYNTRLWIQLPQPHRSSSLQRLTKRPSDGERWEAAVFADKPATKRNLSFQLTPPNDKEVL